MTTQVIIKSPYGNHEAVRIEAVNPETGLASGYPATVLGDGQETGRDSTAYYVHSGSKLIITEVPKTEVLLLGREATFGEKAVGLAFNPGGRTDVSAIKAEFAAVIDRMNWLRANSNDPEVKRMASIAITEAQTAQMWAVKAATWQN